MKTVDRAEEGITHSLTQMWQLVAKQIFDTKKALKTNDKQLANEVLLRERIIDNYELQIDKRCEQFAAVQSPVAIDLRFVLSHLKMNSNLERIGDMAEGIADFVVYEQQHDLKDDKYSVLAMLDEVFRMLELAFQAYISNDTDLALKIISMDIKVNEIYEKVISLIAKDMVGKSEEQIKELISLVLTVRRAERIGDRCTNLAENIIFHIDAKELKHSENVPLYETI